ncbi:MAG: AAA family ATPase [Bacteroidota bacterium]
MKIKKLHIKNFKSIADLEIIEPNPFTVFVGPNGSGKSNIFEALEFFKSAFNIRLYGGYEALQNRKLPDSEYIVHIETDLFSDNNYTGKYINYNEYVGTSKVNVTENLLNGTSDIRQEKMRLLQDSIQRLFIDKTKLQKINYQDNFKLTFSGDNLEKVLRRLLDDEYKNEEITDWLSLFLPGFEKVDVISSGLSGTDTLLIYETDIEKPFTKDLLSDGTYNILALLTAVFQSDEPQFLCIEEPENGLTPDVIKEMVTLFRNACEEKGHYIWLNTHSQSLVSQLTADEIITVNKIKGETKIKQFKGKDFHGLRMDEAWLTNTLGGGLPW